MGGQYLSYFHQKRKINMVRIKQSGNRLFLYVGDDIKAQLSREGQTKNNTNSNRQRSRTLNTER